MDDDIRTEMLADLSTKVQFLVDHLNEIDQLEEHCFTFPDGDTWFATGHEPS